METTGKEFVEEVNSVIGNDSELTVEEIIGQLKELRRVIHEAQERQAALEEELVSAKDKDWDMISVKKASEKSGLSVATIYRFINSGKLKVKHKGSIKYVSNSELEKLDC